MNDINETLAHMGVIPVIVIDDASKAEELAKALCEGGLPCAEITFRTAAAKEAISIMAKKFPNIIVGAGTVVSTKQVDEAIEAGAKFIVSPCFDAEVVDYCIERKIPVFPGVITPTEINYGIKRGLKILKFFPSETYGGIKAIKALSAPFGGVTFIPTGGVNAQNLPSYLESDKVFACGGTWLATKALIAENNFKQIKDNVAEAVKIVKQVRG